MAEAVLSITLETLRDLSVGEAKFLSGVSDEVEEIRRELMRMKCFLKDADAKQQKDERVRNWVREVKDLCYQVEDVLETFAVEVASKRSGKGIKKVLKRFACLLSEGIALHKVGADVARIKADISNLRTSLQTYGIHELSEGESSKEAKEKQWWLRQTYAHEVEEDFVGMQDQIGQLVSLIIDNDKNHKVISVWGMGGLGKTTLARKIYNHGKVQHCFEAFAWFCITQQCEVKVVLQDILKQLFGERNRDAMGMGEAELVRELYKVQREKKCLIVLDDIWEVDHWKMLSSAFPIADQVGSSKILLTTRNKKVAEKGSLYELRYLTADEGWQLLQKKAFTREEENDIKKEPEHEVVGREIVQKCGNLPLAISAVGGILKSRKTLSEWQMVNEDIDLYLSGREGNREGSGSSIEHVLALSYANLPYNLKPCFLYMGIFREDEEIAARELYHFWIAEGMVSSEKEEIMMDVAERYLSELASRSMVQVQMDDLSMVRRIKSCKLHDLMRDLCLKKGKEEHFLENLDMVDHGGNSSFPETNARRLAIHCPKEIFSNRPTTLLSLERITNQFIRTLSVRGGVLRGRPKFNLCKVLVFQDCKFQERKISKEISKMIHLRYLSLKGCELTELPSSIGDLPYLETLDLRTHYSSDIYLPNDIFSKMKRLRHLYISSAYCRSKKLQLNGLIELETLVGFASDTFRHTDLSELVNLRYFDATVGSIHDWYFISNVIDSWKKIRWVAIGIETEFNLGDDDFRKSLLCQNLNDLMIYGKLIGKLPQYEQRFWPNLIRLKLIETELNEDSMEFLKKLPNLRELILEEEAFVGKEFICGAADFLQLRSLTVSELSNLEKWRVEEGALPNLSSLVISMCGNLEIIPEDGLRYLKNLKELEIVIMPKEFKQKYGMLRNQQREDLNESQHEIN